MQDYYSIDSMTRSQYIEYLNQLFSQDKKLPQEAADIMFLKAIGNKPVLSFLIISSLNKHDFVTVSDVARSVSVPYDREMTSGNALSQLGSILKALSFLGIVEYSEIKDSLGRRTIGYRLNKYRSFYSFVCLNSILRWNEGNYAFPNLMCVFEHHNKFGGKIMDKNGRLTDLRLEKLLESLIGSGISIGDGFETITHVSQNLRDGMSTKDIQDLVCKILDSKDPSHILSQRYRRVASGEVVFRETNELVRFSHIRERIRTSYPELRSKSVENACREIIDKLRLLGFRYVSSEFLDGIIREQIESYSSVYELAYSSRMYEEALKAENPKHKARCLVNSGHHLGKVILASGGDTVPEERDAVFIKVMRNAKRYIERLDVDRLTSKLLILAMRSAFSDLHRLSTKLEFVESADKEELTDIEEHLPVLLETFTASS